ncbi:MAG: thymidylate kinase-like protein [Bacillota bacterium]
MECMQLLESAGVAVCILHGYATYPDCIPSDVDFVVSPRGLQKLPAVLKHGENATGARLVQVIQHEDTCYSYILAHPGANGDVAFLQLDAATDYRRNGRIFFRAEEFLSSRKRFKDFWVPPPHLEFTYYLVKKIAKGYMDERHCSYLSELYLQDPQRCKEQILRFWSSAAAQKLIRAAASNNWDEVGAALSQLRQDLLQTTVRKDPLGVALYWWGELQRAVKRWYQPTGLHVVFLGPDGSGKSSVIAQVEKNLRLAFRRTARRHLRPYLFKPQKGAWAPATNPHAKPPYGRFKSVLKLAYLWFDYTVGYVFRIQPQLVRSTLVLFDRYLDDLLVDPRRYRYGGPLWLARLVARFIPRPDLVILLDAPPGVLQRRKQEVSFEETARQREAYLELVQNLPNGYVVDASKPLDEVIAEVQRIILNYMAERTARRLRLKG